MVLGISSKKTRDEDHHENDHGHYMIERNQNEVLTTTGTRQSEEWVVSEWST